MLLKKIRDIFRTSESLEEKILTNLKYSGIYGGFDYGKIWNPNIITDLQKLDSLLISLLKILRNEGVQIDKINKKELLERLHRLVEDKGSLLQKSSNAQILEIVLPCTADEDGVGACFGSIHGGRAIGNDLGGWARRVAVRDAAGERRITNCRPGMRPAAEGVDY